MSPTDSIRYPLVISPSIISPRAVKVSPPLPRQVRPKPPLVLFRSSCGKGSARIGSETSTPSSPNLRSNCELSDQPATRSISWFHPRFTPAPCRLPPAPSNPPQTLPPFHESILRVSEVTVKGSSAPIRLYWPSSLNRSKKRRLIPAPSWPCDS